MTTPIIPHPHVLDLSRTPRKVWCANGDGRPADIYLDSGKAVCSRCFCAMLAAAGRARA